MRQLFLFWNRNPYLCAVIFSVSYAKSISIPPIVSAPTGRSTQPCTGSEPVSVASTPETDEIDQLFDDMQLDGIVSYTAFRQAVTGYRKIEQKSKSIMTLIDFSKPSTEKRLYVLDMKNKKLLYTSVVSHGKNSGGNYATSFSNKNGSYKVRLAFT